MRQAEVEQGFNTKYGAWRYQPRRYNVPINSKRNHFNFKPAQ